MSVENARERMTAKTGREERLREAAFASSVLRQEAHALTLLACGLDGSFCEATDCLYG
ncbi:hypothetical protein HMPREF1022_02947, partial [Desulfovibrio sp. 6_1_46AFAA]